jgi:hypothetical protein
MALTRSRLVLISSLVIIGLLVVFNAFYWLWRPLQSHKLVQPDIIDSSAIVQTADWWQRLPVWWWVGLLGVIVIVLVATGIGVSRWQRAIRQRRDITRRQALSILQQGLEAYAITTGHYPVSARLDERAIPAVGLGYEWERLDFPSNSELHAYLPQWPVVDPLVSYDEHKQYNQYLYYPKNQGQAFALYAHLENAPKGAPDYNQLAGLPKAWGEYNYCLESKKEVVGKQVI